jgi:hypothetical protein
MFLTVCGRKKEAPYLGPGMTPVIYFGELIFAVAAAFALLATSTFKPPATRILFCCGILAWTWPSTSHIALCYTPSPQSSTGLITPVRKTPLTISSALST